jgi:membrane protein YdbS with pleckstrin-like domain
MFDWVRTRVLRVMRVPHDPEPPFGAPGSVRIFRAGSNYYNLRLCRWGLGQVVGVIGVGVSLYFFSWFKDEVRIVQLASQQVVPAAVPPPVPADNSPAARATAAAKAKRLRQIASFRQIATHTTPWMIILLEIFEAGGVLLFLAQIPVSFAIVRLEFEMHWYIVTDRSLRIRTGVVRLQESTMSFANLQQVEVKQDPLQRLLGLADVRVQSAGGGGDQAHRRGREGDSLHTGIFHSVDNATEIRNLILERLRQFRQAGLGDHDDHHDSVTAGVAPPPTGASDTLAAAQELLAEARALRRVLSPGH